MDSLRSKHGGYWRYPHVDFIICSTSTSRRQSCMRAPGRGAHVANSYPSSQRVVAELARWKDQQDFTADNLVVGNGSSSDQAPQRSGDDRRRRYRCRPSTSSSCDLRQRFTVTR